MLFFFLGFPFIVMVKLARDDFNYSGVFSTDFLTDMKVLALVAISAAVLHLLFGPKDESGKDIIRLSFRNDTE